MWKPFLLYPLSFFLVAFGQPAWSGWVGLLAACGGYALFWIALNEVQGAKARFGIATAWFALVQAVQLFWFVSHPYLYIWSVYLFLCGAIGLQFGLFSLFVRPFHLEKIGRVAALAGFWTLLEWLRLWFLSGFSWNPVGLSLSGALYPLQSASIAGIYGLSFWVIFVNLLALRAFYWKSVAPWVISAMLPFVFGWIHVAYHEGQMREKPPKYLSALLVQTAFPIEECLGCPPKDLISYVEGEWQQILRLLQSHKQEKIDLIALPEYVVPFGTWTPVWKADRVKKIFVEIWGEEALWSLPPLEAPWGHFIKGEWVVTNAYYLQGMANLFHADVISGLEDAERKGGEVEYYNAAIAFKPWNYEVDNNRYVKRVLVPLGEYIPFEFCRKLAASYGVAGSFTPGKEAGVFQGKEGAYGLSICYEETYADLMRENKRQGAEVLLNLTSDVWYPNSRLPQQHLDHARPRTLEGGLPLLRACNTGVTCGIDSLGRTVATLGNDEGRQAALKVHLPLYHYATLYSWTGDTLIIGFSTILTALLFLRRNNKIP